MGTTAVMWVSGPYTSIDKPNLWPVAFILRNPSKSTRQIQILILYSLNSNTESSRTLITVVNAASTSVKLCNGTTDNEKLTVRMPVANHQTEHYLCIRVSFLHAGCARVLSIIRQFVSPTAVRCGYPQRPSSIHDLCPWRLMFRDAPVFVRRMDSSVDSISFWRSTQWCRTSCRWVSPRVRDPSFLLDVVVRLYLVIVNSNCSHKLLLVAHRENGHLRCGLYTTQSVTVDRRQL